MYYGQKVKTFLQKAGDTIYMPHLVLHSVWNLSPTIAIGDNPLYQSSFVEFIGSGGLGTKSFTWIQDRVSLFAKENNLIDVMNVQNQIKEHVERNNMTTFKKPLLWKSESGVLCKGFEKPNWKLV